MNSNLMCAVLVQGKRCTLHVGHTGLHVFSAPPLSPSAGDFRVVGLRQETYTGSTWVPTGVRYKNVEEAQAVARGERVVWKRDFENENEDDDLAKAARRGLIQDAMCIDLIRLDTIGPHLDGLYGDLPPDISNATDEDKADAWAEIAEELIERQKKAHERVLAHRVATRKTRISELSIRDPAFATMSGDPVIEVAKRMK